MGAVGLSWGTLGAIRAVLRPSGAVVRPSWTSKKATSEDPEIPTGFRRFWSPRRGGGNLGSTDVASRQGGGVNNNVKQSFIYWKPGPGAALAEDHQGHPEYTKCPLCSGSAPRAFPGLFLLPRRLPELQFGRRTAPDGFQIAPGWPKMASRRPQRPPRRPKTALRGPLKGPQEAPRRPPGGPQEAPKRLPRGPKEASSTAPPMVSATVSPNFGGEGGEGGR